MSEQVNLPAFNPTDILPNASENDVYGPETAILAMLGSDEEAYGDGSENSDTSHDHFIRLRRDALVRADGLFRQKDYMGTIHELKWVLEDLNHAKQLNQIREFPITEVMELCYGLSSKARAKGALAVADVVSLAGVPSLEISLTPVVIETLAS